MKYAFSCSVPKCSAVLTTTADNLAEATEKITVQDKNHLKNAHPEIQKSDKQIRDDVETGTILETKIALTTILW